MRTRTFAALVLSVLLVCGVAQGAEWVSIAKASNGNQEFFVDTSSIRATGDIRRAWVKTIFVPHTMKNSDSPIRKWWAYDLAREAFNCAEETYSKEALTVHYEDGTIKTDPPELFPTQWIPVAPESVLDAEMKFLCSWKLN